MPQFGPCHSTRSRVKRLGVCIAGASAANKFRDQLHAGRAEVGREIPGVAERILDGGGTVAIGLGSWWLDRTGTGAQSPCIKSIRVRNVDMQVTRHGLELAVGFVDFERGIADFDGR